MADKSSGKKPRILVTDGIHPVAKTILERDCEVLFEPKLSDAELITYLPEIDGLMVRSATQVTQSVLEQAPRFANCRPGRGGNR